MNYIKTLEHINNGLTEKQNGILEIIKQSEEPLTEIEKELISSLCQGCGKKCSSSNSISDLCDDCYECGCPNCYNNIIDNLIDNEDDSYEDKYYKRRANLYKELKKTIHVSKLGKEIWEKYFSKDFLSYCYPSQSENLIRKLPPNPYLNAINYNIIRIISGMPSLNYKS